MPRDASAPNKFSSAHLDFEAKLWLAAHKLRVNIGLVSYKCAVLSTKVSIAVSYPEPR